MRVKISDCEIPSSMLRYVVSTLGTALVTFGGVAPLNQIAPVQRRLIMLSHETALQYEAVDADGIPSGGLCNLVNLKFEVMNTRPPVLSFSGQLVYPFHRND